MKADRHIVGIILNGGLVQEIVTTHGFPIDCVDFVVVDYDVDGVPEEDLTGVPQGGDRGVSQACVSHPIVGVAAIPLEKLL